jgi:hypothetical protein
MAAAAPEAIMALPSTGEGVRTQQHAAIVAASPVFWLQLLPARGVIWETETVAGIEPRSGRRGLVRRNPVATRTATYKDLSSEMRDALMPIAEGADMRFTTLMHVAYWAWRVFDPDPRRFVDPSMVPGEPGSALSWRVGGRRRKRRLLESVAAMRLRWAKQAGLIATYYDALGADVQQSAVTRRISRVESQVPQAFRPAPNDATHKAALVAMMLRLDSREGVERLKRDIRR